MILAILKILLACLFPFVLLFLPVPEFPAQLKRYAYVAWIMAIVAGSYNYWLIDNTKRSLPENILCLSHIGASCPTALLTLPYWIPGIFGVPKPPESNPYPNVSPAPDLGDMTRRSEPYVQGAKGELLVGHYREAINLLNSALDLCSTCHPEAFIYRGDAYRALKNYEQAKTDYKRALGLNSDDPAVYNGLGLSWLGIKKPAQALIEFNEAIARSPKAAANYENRGDAYFLESQYDLAIADYGSALQLDPVSDTVPRKLSNALSVRGTNRLSSDSGKAFEDLKAAAKADDTYALAFLRLADAYAATHQYLDAIANYEAALKLDPHLPSALVGEGSAYVALSDYGRAIDSLVRSVTLNPNDASAYYNLGRAYNASNKGSEAKDALDHAIKLNPNFPEAFKERGNAFLSQQQNELALADYNTALKLKPNYPEALNNIGVIYTQEGKVDQALSYFGSAIKLRPDFPIALRNRALSFYGVGAFGKAIRDLSTAIELRPRQQNLYAERGNAFEALSDYANAIKDYNMAVSLDPKDPGVLKDRGNARRDSGDLGGALDDYTAALALNSEFPEAYENKGVALCQSGNWSTAVDNLNKAISLRSDYVAAWDARGNVFAAQGKMDLAHKDFDVAHKLNPAYRSSQTCFRSTPSAPPPPAQVPLNQGASAKAADVPGQLPQPQGSINTNRQQPSETPSTSLPNNNQIQSQGAPTYYDQRYSVPGQTPATNPLVPPKLIGEGKCNNYPEAARRANAQGDVTLSIDVSRYGSVEFVKIVISSGTDALDEAAIDCVRAGWHFNPATQAGSPVEGTFSAHIQFQLADTNRPSENDDDQ